MNSLHKYISQLQTPEFLGIFVLMLSTFLIGYLFGLYLEKTKKRSASDGPWSRRRAYHLSRGACAAAPYHPPYQPYQLYQLYHRTTVLPSPYHRCHPLYHPRWTAHRTTHPPSTVPPHPPSTVPPTHRAMRCAGRAVTVL